MIKCTMISFAALFFTYSAAVQGDTADHTSASSVNQLHKSSLHEPSELARSVYSLEYHRVTYLLAHGANPFAQGYLKSPTLLSEIKTLESIYKDYFYKKCDPSRAFWHDRYVLAKKIRLTLQIAYIQDKIHAYDTYTL